MACSAATESRAVSAATIRRTAAVAPRLEEAANMPTEAAMARLTAVPGIGPWTAAEVGELASETP